MVGRGCIVGAQRNFRAVKILFIIYNKGLIYQYG